MKLPGRSFSLVDQIFCSIVFFSGSKGIVQGAAHPPSPAHYLRSVRIEVLRIAKEGRGSVGIARPVSLRNNPSYL